MSADRRFVYRTLHNLKDLGFPVKKVHANYTYLYYYDPSFTTGEAFFLLDSIQNSPSLSSDTKETLRNKLITLLPQDQKAYILETPADFTSSTNENLLNHIRDLLIAKHSQHLVTFRYFDYDTRKKRVYRKQGSFYTGLPLGLVSNEGKFYCVLYHPDRKKAFNYRIDKMDFLSVSEKTCEMENAFDLQRYVRNSFNMYSSAVETVLVSFSASTRILSRLYDYFGIENIQILSEDSRLCTASIRTAITPETTGWFLSNTEECSILKPQSLIDQLKEHAITILKTYTEGGSLT